jgi:hypothetical protein
VGGYKNPKSFLVLDDYALIRLVLVAKFHVRFYSLSPSLFLFRV